MKTLLLLSVPFAACSIILFAWALSLRSQQPRPVLIIRQRDRAIFTPAERDPESEDPPQFVRLQWAERSWLPGGHLVPTGELWSPESHRDFDVVAAEYVEAGCKELAQRSKA